MQRWNRSLIVVFASSLALLGDPRSDTSLAQEIEADRLFLQLDRNADRSLTPAEINPSYASFFSRLLRTSDENEDGRLTEEEFSAGLQPIRAPKAMTHKNSSQIPGGAALVVLVSRMDANADRTVDRGEIPANLATYFDRMVAVADDNEDGRLSMREVVQGAPRLARIAQRWKMQRGIDIDAEYARLSIAQKGAFEAPYGRERPIAKNMLARFDADGNEILSLRELPPRLAKRLRPLDSNGDGLLDEAELSSLARPEASRAD